MSERPGAPAAARAAGPAHPATIRRAGFDVMGLLFVAAAAFVLSLVLPWHQRWIAAAGVYRTVYGIDVETWVIGGAALVVGLLGLLSRRRAGMYTKLAAAGVSFVMLVGVIVDYIDWQSEAASTSSAAYFGPGFYVTLGGTGALLVATVLIWRRLESWY